MVRGLILGSAVAATALATASFPAFAYGCRNGRSTDPNCYREYGYVCGPCYNDWSGEGWRRNDQLAQRAKLIGSPSPEGRDYRGFLAANSRALAQPF